MSATAPRLHAPVTAIAERDGSRIWSIQLTDNVAVHVFDGTRFEQITEVPKVEALLRGGNASALGLPEDYQSRYVVRLCAFQDPNRALPSVALVGFGSSYLIHLVRDETGALKFEREELAFSAPGYRDLFFAFHGPRAELCALVRSDRDLRVLARVASGAWVVRGECAGTKLDGSLLGGGYCAARRALVFFDASGEAMSLDDDGRWADVSDGLKMYSQTVLVCPDAQGRLCVIGKPRTHESVPWLVQRLEHDGWAAFTDEGLRELAAMAFLPATQTVYGFGAKLGKTELDPSMIVWTEDGIEVPARRRPGRPVRVTPEPGTPIVLTKGIVRREGAPDFEIIASVDETLVHAWWHGATLRVLGETGAVYRLEKTKLVNEHRATPRAASSREAAIAHDSRDGALYVLGGVPDAPSVVYRSGAFHDLPSTNDLPVVLAKAAWDHPSNVLVVVGGNLKDGTFNAATWEYDGIGWHAFPLSFDGRRAPFAMGVRLETDAASGRAVLRKRSEGLYVYAGLGEWTRIESGSAAGTAPPARRAPALVERPRYFSAEGEPLTVERPGRTAFVMKLDPRGDDQLGGLPPGISEERWPRDHRGDPMTFAALLRAHPERLPLARHAALAVFMERDLAFENGNAVLLLDHATLDAAVHAPPDGTTVLDAHAIAYEPVFEPDPAYFSEREPTDVSKVGGYPSFLHGACHAPFDDQGRQYRVVAQLTRVGTHDPLGLDSAIGYVSIDHDETKAALGFEFE